MSSRVWAEDMGDGPRVPVRCPDCGPVEVEPDAWDDNEPASGLCPNCGNRLYFAGHDDPTVCSWCGGSGGGPDPATRCNHCLGSGLEPDDEEGECEDCGATIHPEDDYWPFWCFECAAGPSDRVRRKGRAS